MRTFSCPAKYRRHVEAELALILAGIKRDVDRRSDEDVRIQAMASVPEHLIESTLTGRLVILVGVPEDAATIEPEQAAA